MTTVALCIPSGDRWHAGFAMDVAKLTGYTPTQDPTLALAILNVKGSILPQVRATLAQQALAVGADYLFWLDSDMRFPKDTLLRLLAHQQNVVGGNYPTRQPPILPTAHNANGPVYTDEVAKGLVPVDRLGFGCVLVKQEVFATMERPWFAFGYARSDDGYVGEDYYWFQKAREKGYTIWLDHDLSQDLLHLGEIPLSNRHAAAARAEEFARGIG